jgi:adenosylcobinamide-GDP ribazoletransferase
MRTLLAALQFLTILPVSSGEDGERHLENAAWFFPVVGLLIGAFLASCDLGLLHLLPVLPASVLAVILFMSVSGCLHLDGLADTADGFLSSRPREKILEIMKDSRSGPMGVAAIVSVFALKLAAIYSLPQKQRFAGLLLMALAGRCAMVWMLALLKYARPEGGLAAIFARKNSVWPAVFSLLVLVSAGWLALSWPGLIVAGAALPFTLLFCLYCHRKIGGFTGDTLGAACELVELLPALALEGMARVAGWI